MSGSKDSRCIIVPERTNEIVMASLEKLRQGLTVHMREPGFYVAAVVGVDNHASRKVAARTLCNTPDAIDDSGSGLSALHYIKRVV